MQPKRTRVLSVDDHAFLAEGLRARLSLEPDMEVVGHLARADHLAEKVAELHVDVVLLDIEMPGKDPFLALAELRRVCPAVRTIILSAYVRDRYVDATVKAGAWGYLAKSDDPETIIRAVRDVTNGRFTFGPAVLERCRHIGVPENPAAAAAHAPPARPRTTGAKTDDTPDGPGAEGEGPAGVHAGSRLAALTTRELQVLRMIGRGLSRTQIADSIFRSPKTVDAHRAAIMEKLDIRDRVELARFAIREGLVELD
ncbi:MAG: response regulator [Phycisphaerales bacterium]